PSSDLALPTMPDRPALNLLQTLPAISPMPLSKPAMTSLPVWTSHEAAPVIEFLTAVPMPLTLPLIVDQTLPIPETKPLMMFLPVCESHVAAPVIAPVTADFALPI